MQNLATLVVDPDGKGLETHWRRNFSSPFGWFLLPVYKLNNQGEPIHFPILTVCWLIPILILPTCSLKMTQYPHIEGKTHPVTSASARDP